MSEISSSHRLGRILFVALFVCLALIKTACLTPVQTSTESDTCGSQTSNIDVQSVRNYSVTNPLFTALPLLGSNTHSPVEMTTEETIYGEAKSYWESVPATVSGMLGGFTQVNSVDLAASNKFIRHFTQGNKPVFKPVRAVDCGCGIGRVTKRLLLPLFQTVDMVDISQSFIDEARNYLGPDSSRVDKLICSSLHHFVPEQGRYDAIWCQWVLGQLTEDDLIAFFRRCKAGLTNNGILFVKENMGDGDQPVFDEQDRAWTRSRAVWLDLIHRAGLKVVKEEKQPSFPKDLYEVRMFAIQ